jgi:cytochrome c556
MTQNIERHVERLDRALAAQRDDASVRENTAGVIQSAQGLQLSADVIMTMRASLPLRAEAATIYVERATQLKGFATELESLARAGRLNELSPVVAQVNASCNSCHQLFRAP